VEVRGGVRGSGDKKGTVGRKVVSNEERWQGGIVRYQDKEKEKGVW